MQAPHELGTYCARQLQLPQVLTWRIGTVPEAGAVAGRPAEHAGVSSSQVRPCLRFKPVCIHVSPPFLPVPCVSLDCCMCRSLPASRRARVALACNSVLKLAFLGTGRYVCD